MPGKKNASYITDAEFAKLKALTNAGVSYTIVQKLTGRAWATVRRIGESKTFEDYKTSLKADYEKDRIKKGKVSPASNLPQSKLETPNDLLQTLARIEQRVINLDEKLSKEAEIRKVPFWR